MEFSLDGYCGLYCGACPTLLGSRAGTEPKPCHGCKSEIISGWCLICDLKACARGKGVDFCSACGTYPCEKLEAFKTSEKYPYHREVSEYMSSIDAEGKAAWLEKMKTRWSCPECGQQASWWDTSCKECGTGMNGYIKPDTE